MISTIVAILAGIVLLRGTLRNVPALGAWLERAAGTLTAFDVVIGVVAVVLGLLELLSLEGILLVLAGLILAVTALRTIPAIGTSLGNLGQALSVYRVIVGVLILVVGLVGLFQMLFRF